MSTMDERKYREMYDAQCEVIDAIAEALHAHGLPNDAVIERAREMTIRAHSAEGQRDSARRLIDIMRDHHDREVRELLLRGLTDDQVRDHLRARYGDFILFRPDFNARTAWLWLAPVALLLLGLGVAWRVLRRRGALVSEDDSPIEEPRR